MSFPVLVLTKRATVTGQVTTAACLAGFATTIPTVLLKKTYKENIVLNLDIVATE